MRLILGFVIALVSNARAQGSQEDGDISSQSPLLTQDRSGIPSAMRPTTFRSNSNLSFGQIENFSTIYIADRDVGYLTPSTPTTQGPSSLPIVNPTTSWIKVRIDGRDIGVIKGKTTGLIHGVSPGGYDVQIIQSNGYTVTEHLQTITEADLQQRTDSNGPLEEPNTDPSIPASPLPSNITTE